MPQRAEQGSIFKHPLAALGGALFLAGGFAFVVLLLIDFTGSGENPYRALVTFVAAPAIVTLGFALVVLSALLQLRTARKEGRSLKLRLSIDPTDPQFMRNMWLFLGLTAALVILVAYSGSEAYEATDSVGFCGETCHEVMEPQNVTYRNSAHARVRCVDCHIGPGASFWVKSKVDGIRQLFATVRNSYSRPIETPVANLRPAQETCENCHWPQKTFGEKLITRTYFRTDEENSPWTISLLMKVGGGDQLTGEAHGVHWHVASSNKIEYIAADHKRQDIIWVRHTTTSGDTVIFTNPDADIPDLSDPETDIRVFDCMDCHNRPSHRFLAPATAINDALAKGEIPTTLPYIRQVGLDLLNAEYETKPTALAAIDDGLHSYYREEYPDLGPADLRELDDVSAVLTTLYEQNFFPEMHTDYRVRENNLSHFVNDGCFRCHGDVLEDAQGNTIDRDCRKCHTIVAQGPSEFVDSLESNITGLPFKHPEDIDEYWKEAKCTDCHTPESGY